LGTESSRRRAQQAGNVAHIITGSEGELLAWSETLPVILGLEPTTMPANTRAWLNCVHPDDHVRFRETAEAAARGARRVDVDYRLRSGPRKWLHVRAVTEPLDQDKYTAPGGLWLSTLQDFTTVRGARAARTMKTHGIPRSSRRLVSRRTR